MRPFDEHGYVLHGGVIGRSGVSIGHFDRMCCLAKYTEERKLFLSPSTMFFRRITLKQEPPKVSLDLKPLALFIQSRILTALTFLSKRFSNAAHRGDDRFGLVPCQARRSGFLWLMLSTPSADALSVL